MVAIHFLSIILYFNWTSLKSFNHFILWQFHPCIVTPIPSIFFYLTKSTCLSFSKFLVILKEVSLMLLGTNIAITSNRMSSRGSQQVADPDTCLLAEETWYSKYSWSFWLLCSQWTAESVFPFSEQFCLGSETHQRQDYFYETVQMRCHSDSFQRCWLSSKNCWRPLLFLILGAWL